MYGGIQLYIFILPHAESDLPFFSAEKYTAAEGFFRSLLVIWEGVLGRENPDTPMSVSQLRLVRDRQGQYKEAGSVQRGRDSTKRQNQCITTGRHWKNTRSAGQAGKARKGRSDALAPQ